MSVGRSLENDMRQLKVDSKNRVVLETGLRKTAGIAKGDKLTAIAFHGGIILTSTKGEKFSESLRGFGFREEEHEATKYVMKRLGVEVREDAGT
jgi:bifunctional DNA-binding transcriptional regulator/antitoxin component of YhaV-PrlF toxin-antitoxin module